MTTLLHMTTLQRTVLSALATIMALGAATHVQSAGGAPSGAQAVTASFNTTPAAGDLLVIATQTYNNASATAPTVACADSNNNSYIMGALAGGSADNGFVAVGYILSAPD